MQFTAKRLHAEDFCGCLQPGGPEGPKRLLEFWNVSATLADGRHFTLYRVTCNPKMPSSGKFLQVVTGAGETAGFRWVAERKFSLFQSG